MRILLAAKHTSCGPLKIGGVQSWIDTIAAEFRSLGHTVCIWGKGSRQDFILSQDIKFDLGIFANLKYTKHLLQFCKETKKISHGIIPDEAGEDGWLFTSEEVRGKLRGDIVRQPIDLSFWRPNNYNRVFFTRFSYRKGELSLSNIPANLGLKYKRVKNSSPEQCRDILQRSKIVLATGRAALEAMACGARVVIADNRGYQDPLVDFYTLDSMRRNYSGRGGVFADSETIEKAIEHSEHPDRTMEHIFRYHNSKMIAEQLLC